MEASKNVIVIPARKVIGTQKINEEVKKVRVAAYARVSTDNQEQELSYDEQISHYTQFIKSNSDWKFVNVYADDGVSATRTAKRDGFNQMMEDAEAGKIDRIYTKSISRFARNTVDCLNAIRKLNDLNIPVIFEKEGVDTSKTSGEFFVTILAAMAQQESESLAANVKLGLEYRNQRGKVAVNHEWFLGYTKDEEGKLIIDPQEAAVVKRIYKEFLDGSSLAMIKKSLEADGILNGAKHAKWHVSNIKQILTNEKYIGDALLQKTVTVSTVQHKRKKNEGSQKQYYVENNHEAIISKDIFARTQEELIRRANLTKGSGKTKRVYSGRYALTGVVFCGDCGDVYRRIPWYIHGRIEYNWRCVNRVENGTEACMGRNVKEKDLQEAIVNAVNRTFKVEHDFIDTLKENMRTALKAAEEEELVEISSKMKYLQEKILGVKVDSPEMDKLGTEIQELRAEKERVEMESVTRRNKYDNLCELESLVETCPKTISEYDDVLVRKFIERIDVTKEGFNITFKSGFEIKIA